MRWLFFLFLLAFCGPVFPQQADLVLVNANVITLRSAGDRASALLSLYLSGL